MTAPAAPPARPAAWWDLDRSLRSRLVAASMLAVVVAVSGVVGVAFLTVRRELRAPLESQLRRQTLSVQRQAAAQRGLSGIRLVARVGEVGGYAQVVQDGGAVIPISNPPGTLPVSAAELEVAQGTRDSVLRDVTVGGETFRVLTSRLLPGSAVQVALPESTVRTQLRRLAAAFGLLAAAGLALAAGLAWAVSRRALAPVTALTEAAERIAATNDLTLRIDARRRDELGRLAASFNTMLAALQQSVGAQRRLVADASHELRTPLASLRTNVEVLRRVDELPADVREEVVTAIVGQVEELTALVADVVELARGDEPEAALEDVAFDEVVRNAADRARRHWPRNEFRVGTEPVVVRGVARRLDRAVANLLDNAAKFSGAGGAVDVTLARDGRLTVRDHGPGVPEDALPLVFGRFYRADEARALPGSGLGLAIVKQAVESHGGTVALTNAPDGGTIAEIALPPGAGSNVLSPPRSAR